MSFQKIQFHKQKKAFTLVFFMKSIYLFAVKMYENRILHSFTNVNTRYHWDSNTN